ncbi:hypothetical protein HPB50_014938 [Hyalomma asiaticum]|uniref:Uncharacterized protein n=1 Tax=Hyalomma asiaticum TaxID=266040 RepID=A0ACB7SMJ7_HYAAI|nr:hypothetical protein HPB50_014938 [Hyalomma asiaticum]
MPGFAKSHWIYQRCQLSTTKFSGNHAHRKTENSPDELLRDLAPPWTPDAYTVYFYRTTQCAVRWRLGDDLCDVLNLRAVRGRNVYVPRRGRRSDSRAVSFAGRPVHGRTSRPTSCCLGVIEALPPVPPREDDRARDRARGRAKPCRFVLTVALRVRLRPRGAEYVFAEQFQWAGTPGSTAAPLSVTTALTELRHRTLDDFDSVTSLATSSSPLNRMSIF